MQEKRIIPPPLKSTHRIRRRPSSSELWTSSHFHAGLFIRPIHSTRIWCSIISSEFDAYWVMRVEVPLTCGHLCCTRAVSKFQPTISIFPLKASRLLFVLIIFQHIAAGTSKMQSGFNLWSTTSQIHKHWMLKSDENTDRGSLLCARWRDTCWVSCAHCLSWALVICQLSSQVGLLKVWFFLSWMKKTKEQIIITKLAVKKA